MLKYRNVYKPFILYNLYMSNENIYLGYIEDDNKKVWYVPIFACYDVQGCMTLFGLDEV